MVNNQIFDRKLLFKNFERYSKYDFDNDIVYEKICNKIIEDLEFLKLSPINVLELNYKSDKLFNYIKSSCNLTNYVKGNKEVIFDDEYLPFKNNTFDLIISNLSMHFINQIPNYLLQLKQILTNNGSLLITFFGEDNFIELSQSIYHAENSIYQQITPRIIPTIDIKTAGQLMTKSGFKNIVVDVDQIQINYKKVEDFLNNIKNLVLANILVKRSRRFFTKKLLNQLTKYYQQNYTNSSGEIYATFKIITIFAQKKL